MRKPGVPIVLTVSAIGILSGPARPGPARPEAGVLEYEWPAIGEPSGRQTVTAAEDGASAT